MDISSLTALRPKRLLNVAFVFLLLLPLVAVSPAPLGAVSQNEVLINVLYDGTPDFDASEAAPTGVAPEPHSPGLDGGPQNGVVRTWDQFAVRVDWNVNEDAATGVFLTVELPSFAQWSPDGTGMFAGCDPAASSFPDDQTLLCSLGDQIEGSNGAIRPVAILTESFDNTTFDVTATLTTDDDTAGVSDGLDQELTVSEAPFVDHQKSEPVVSDELSTSGGNGYVVLYPLTFFDFSQGEPIKGVGPINDAVDIELYDHMWSLTPNARLATQAELTAAAMPGTPCGPYAGTDAFVAPSLPATGTWTCGTPVTGAGGYQVVPITIADFQSRPAPATLADGSANTPVPQISSGQIAVWLDSTEVDAAIADPNNAGSIAAASFDNALVAEDESTVITMEPDVLEAPGNGTSGPVVQGPPENNNVSVGFGAAPVGGPPGTFLAVHDIRYHAGPLTVEESLDFGDPRYLETNERLPGQNWYQGRADGVFPIGQVARGSTNTLRAFSLVTVDAGAGADLGAPIHGCYAFDTTHYALAEFAPIPVTQTLAGATVAGSTVASNEGPLAHAYAGTSADRGLAIGGALADVDVIVEFTNAPLSTHTPSSPSFGANNDEVTCAEIDAGSSGWVSSTDVAGLAQFDTVNPGDGLYEGITRARVRTESFSWESVDADSDFHGFHTFFQIAVKTDLAVQTVDQELFALAGYSFGELDADGVPDLRPAPGADPTDCRPLHGTWNLSGNDDATTTGWCSNAFQDDGADSFDTSDDVAWDIDSGNLSCCNPRHYQYASGTLVRIVEAQLGLDKVNNDGIFDIKDNGENVIFTLSPRVIGSPSEALTNVRVSDPLPANYEFVQFVSLPTSPGATCTEAGGTINCQFSEPNPATDTGPLPAGLPGGWSDQFEIEVTVVGAVANPDSPVQLTNSANIRSSGLGPWDDASGDFSGAVEAVNKRVNASASSYLPLPADEGAIIKAVDGLEGPCELHPDEDPPPAGWADRCSMIDYDGDMSFVLSFTNEGNTAFSDIQIIDVFPHNLDESEPASGTNLQGGSPSTLGDGRTPDSDFEGTLGFVSMAATNIPAGAIATTYVSGDAALSISRDPAVSVDGAAPNTWCDAVGGTAVIGSGTCPATPELVTATYTHIDSASNPGDPILNPNSTLDLRLTLDSEGVECDDIWTNTFGLRTAEILLPIRSNDVSIMVNCEFDLALEKTIDPAFVPGADWLTAGASTIDFLMEVTNQGDPVEDFHVTDYVDTDVFTFVATDNAAGTTTGDQALPFTWDATDPAAPVAMIDGALGNGESVLVPVTLVIEDSSGPLVNWAEISYFDNDGDPSNGDSDPANPNNPSTGHLVDEDSFPDAIDQDPAPTGPGAPGDGEIDGDGSGSDPVTGDEDDHDVAGIEVYDLELIKTPGTPTFDFGASPATVTYDLTVTNQGTSDVFFVDVTDYGAPGLTYNAAATAAAWTAAGLTGVTDANPTFTIAGPVAPAASVIIPVVYDMDLSQAPFTNAAEISAFDSDNDPANAADPLAVDVDSTPDDSNDDDVINHNVLNNDPDGDLNYNESTPGDEDDHDIETIAPYDLALQKRIDPNDPDLLDGVSQGDELTFFIEVYNQASPIEDFHVTDYVSSSWIFDPAANPAATTTGDQALDFTWDVTDPSAPVAMVDGALANGESVIIPVVLTVNVSDASEGLFNYAEISYFDNDGDPSNGDSDPTNLNNPSTGPLVDIDSTPDGDDTNDLLTDDVLDNSNDDEDDHDQAFTMWWDLELIKERSASQSYVIDPSVIPLTVSFDLTVNNQGGEDALNVAVLDTPPAGLTFDSVSAPVFTGAADAAETVTNTATNEFTVSGLSAGEQVTFTVTYALDLATAALPSVNIAEISAMEGEWDPDGPFGPLAPGVYPVADIDSTPNSDPTDDVVSTDGVTDPADSHNTLDNDPDGDGNLHNANGIDEDDHDSEAIVLPWDLALTKTFVAADQPLVPGGTVTMLITVTNQGPAVETIEVTDYLDPAMWAGFDAALNPDGTVDASSTAAAAFGFAWDGADTANPVVTVTPTTPGDKIGFGETIAVPITVAVAPGFDTTQQLINVAEISNFDSDQDPANGDAADGSLVDIDSTPDSTDESTSGETIGGDLVDDAIDGNGGPGADEDDHDPVIIPIMDLALRKTVDPSTAFPVSAGSDVTFALEVINQGNTHATGITLIDYVDPAMWNAFDVAANPAGTTTGDAAVAYTWAANANGQDGDVTITGPLAPGETVFVPVTLTIAAGANLEALSNAAEISGATASDEAGIEVTMPDGSPVVDVDSVADTDNTDPLTDDVVDGSSGDEDDHDIALVQAPTYSLGNQVWEDTNNDGVLDAGEEPIEGVTVELFTDNDGDGLPDDTNGDGVIDSADAIATTTTGPDGDYLFEDLVTGDYIVGIAPSNWEEGGPLDNWLSSDPTSTDPNDDVDDNDDGTPDASSGYVLSGPVTLDDSEPTGEPGLDNDPNTPDSLSNLTVDFGFWQPIFDLALEKTIASGQDVTNLVVGDDVTFTIEVFNQGTVSANDISVIDYLPTGMTLNDSDWTDNGDGTASIDLDGVTVAAGDSTTVDITVTLASAGDLDNHAEITNAVAVNVAGVSLTEPDGTPIEDFDSVADADNGDTLVDGVTDTNATGGDEDDHDIASISVSPAPTPTIPTLAFTGGESFPPIVAALAFIMFGLALVWRQRRQDEDQLGAIK